ncbi:MAG: redoxin family protein, partial [Deltaproteobacteria bacterium]|nr:redoxin family protein [Deltaproteobacteria bacterium]
GATLQLADWKLDLKGRGDGTVWIAASNLPVHEVAGDWLQIAPPFPSVVKPRTEATKRNVRWQGASQLKFQLTVAGKPLAGARVTLRLSDAAGLTQDAQTATSDKSGTFQVAVPQGVYRVLGLQPSVAGAGSDAYYAADLAFPADRLVQAGETKATLLEATAKAAPATPVAPLDWSNDARVGQGLPEIAVQRWFGLDKPPASLAGKVLLIDVWATWCGPCRATAPQVAELHARLASKGLVVVAASIDKDEQALEEFVREQLPGGPAIAWVGPEAMEVLETESVPTFLVVDSQGRIRGAHKGTGWSVGAAQTWLESLLAEGKAKK